MTRADPIITIRIDKKSKIKIAIKVPNNTPVVKYVNVEVAEDIEISNSKAIGPAINPNGEIKADITK